MSILTTGNYWAKILQKLSLSIKAGVLESRLITTCNDDALKNIMIADCCFKNLIIKKR